MTSPLDLLLSEPTSGLVESLARVPGDILILGAAGKMGPSLARLARRASKAAGTPRRIVAVSRFSNDAVRSELEHDGIETVACDLFDQSARDQLPDCPNVIYMVGQKFGTTGQEACTWAVNAWLAGTVAERFPRSRLVAFSTGNVYPLWPTNTGGPNEGDATGPVGEYAESALARERIFEFFSARNQTPMVILRLNYAIEPRYGVLRDIADRVYRREPVDVGMGYVNVIWQRDANAIALMALSHCAAPPWILNVTGRAVGVRWLAQQFGRRWGMEPTIQGTEAPTALLSDATRCAALFGPPPVGIQEMIDHVVRWVETGGASLGKPTHFEERRGTF